MALNTVGKCSCSAAYCTPVHVQRPGNLSSSPLAGNNVLPILGNLPDSPYEPLRGALAAPDAQLFCQTCEGGWG